MSEFMQTKGGLDLRAVSELVVSQKKELGELLGYESRNKYQISAGDHPIGYAAEQGKGWGAILVRQFAGHWRSFEIHFFDMSRQLVFKAVHPFRFFFQRLEVQDAQGRDLGAIQQRFAVFMKRLDVIPAQGETLEVRSPIWKPWTFELKRNGQVCALIKKKWSGILKEAFMDADNFRVEFSDPTLSQDQRSLILAGAIFVDLQYFEKKASD